jgi:hypothetical protein
VYQLAVVPPKCQSEDGYAPLAHLQKLLTFQQGLSNFLQITYKPHQGINNIKKTKNNVPTFAFAFIAL